MATETDYHSLTVQQIESLEGGDFTFICTDDIPRNASKAMDLPDEMADFIGLARSIDRATGDGVEVWADLKLQEYIVLSGPFLEGGKVELPKESASFLLPLLRECKADGRVEAVEQAQDALDGILFDGSPEA